MQVHNLGHLNIKAIVAASSLYIYSVDWFPVYLAIHLFFLNCGLSESTRKSVPILPQSLYLEIRLKAKLLQNCILLILKVTCFIGSLMM